MVPSNLEVVTEGPSLEDHLNNMTESERSDRQCDRQCDRQILTMGMKDARVKIV